MVCFVILHYMAKDETESCVSNVKSLTGEKKIVIVDNSSPNGSGQELLGKYKEDSDVLVYLNNENAGFARGNNVGCKIAKEKYNPDFYVVMNNDIEIKQQDFISRIEKIWQEEQFDVLGPDIFSTSLEVHQSPKRLENMTIEKAKQLQKNYQKKLNSKFIVPLRCYLKKSRLLNSVYHQQKSKELGINYREKYYDVPLHGSCFVFSRHFIENREDVFFPGTFFYFESEILDFECQKSGFKELYDPSITVFHHQNVSTNTTYHNELERVQFMNKQNYNSISAFLKKYDL